VVSAPYFLLLIRSLVLLVVRVLLGSLLFYLLREVGVRVAEKHLLLDCQLVASLDGTDFVLDRGTLAILYRVKG